MRIKKDISKDLKGFTLIELICILAIIGFLVALLMPALSKTKRIASRVVCGSTMKGFSTVFMIYLDDSDNHFADPNEWFYSLASDTPQHPIGCRWHDWPMAIHGEVMGGKTEYQGVMWDYLIEMTQPTCPDFRDVAKKRGCENPGHNAEIDIRPQYNYTMNAYLGSTIEGGVKSVDQVFKPASKFLFGEENSWSVRPDHPEYPVRDLKAPLSTKALDDTALLITPTPKAENCFATFHGASKNLSDGASNMAFIDGHVGVIRKDEQLRKNMHDFAGRSRSRSSYESGYEERSYHPGGNLWYAWPIEEPPAGGWDNQ